MLVLSCFLLFLVVLFRSPAGALIIVGWLLPLVVLVAKESTDRLLAGGVVRHYVHQLVDALQTILPQFSYQVFTCGA